MTSRGDALHQCSQQLHRAKVQLQDVERASKEGWRHANELEQERARLQRALELMISDMTVIAKSGFTHPNQKRFAEASIKRAMEAMA
jgi:acyl-CoA thioesterase